MKNEFIPQNEASKWKGSTKPLGFVNLNVGKKEIYVRDGDNPDLYLQDLIQPLINADIVYENNQWILKGYTVDKNNLLIVDPLKGSLEMKNYENEVASYVRWLNQKYSNGIKE